jgi:hypothetical protein
MLKQPDSDSATLARTATHTARPAHMLKIRAINWQNLAIFTDEMLNEGGFAAE